MEQKPKKKTTFVEYAVTTALTVHLVSMLFLSLYYGWPNWIAISIGIVTVVLWILIIGKFQTHKVRAIVTSVILSLAIVTYAYFIRDPFAVMIPLCSITVIIGLYDVIGAIFPPIAAFCVIIGFQIFDIVTKHQTEYKLFTGLLFPTFNCLCICGFVIYWIYKRQKSNKALIDTIAEMQKAQDTKDDFLANVSHEIRTPINSISGIADSLLHENDPMKLTDDLYSIQMASKSLMFVVSDIMDFSELESGVITLEEEEYNTVDTINDMVNMGIAQNMTGKPIELILNYPPDLPSVLVGDEKKLRRAVMNIVGNAYKFTEEGCVVIDISFRKEDYGINLNISVRDTGIGMHPEELEKLFSTYNQADASRSRNEGGIGLGLAISRAIIQKMGGTISVFSTYEKGTEVRFVIPQKVKDYQPIISIQNSDEDCVGIYFNLEQFSYTDTRDEYLHALRTMQSNLAVKSFYCRNLAELKRRQAENHFTHIFISLMEYLEDSEYFDRLSEELELVLVLDRANSTSVTNPNIYKAFKPFQIMPIAQALNGTLSSGKNSELPVEHFTAPNATVLVVDDNEMNIRVAEGLLRKFEIQPAHALSGAQSIKMLEETHYDLIFMDHMMPEMDGVETLHKIREHAGKYYREVPVVALTANAIAGAREMLLGEGFTDFMEKPIELAVLERVLARNLPETKLVKTKKSEAVSENTTPENTVPVMSSEKTDPSESDSAGNFTYDSLDKAQGAVYCGDENSWEEILRIYAEKKSENYLPLQELYESEDWKNYTIMIHGVKSSMKSVGAGQLSEQARLLEMAGREGNIDYIREHHAAVFEMYKALVLDLMKHFGVEEKSGVDISGLPDFPDEEMEKLVSELEDAMYNLDGDTMTEALKRAKGFRYHEKALDPVIDTVEQKIKMADYMSAFDAFVKIR